MDRPTLRQLEYAVAVADHLHFGRAAEAVAVSQPGLSGQIHELERRLGVQLFERSSRQVRVTTAGAEVVGRARAVLRDVDELALAAAAHHGTLRGRLRVAAIPTMAPYLLPALTHALHDRWPDATLELTELRTVDLVVAVERGEIDLGLLATPVDTGALHVEVIGSEPFLLALPDDHDMAGTDEVPVSALRDLPVLLLEEGHCLREHALAACEIAGRVEHSEVRAASLATLAQMVASGVGVTLLPASAVPVDARPGTGLEAVPFEAPAPGRTISLTWRPTDPRARYYAEVGSALTAPLGALGITPAVADDVALDM